MEIIIIVNNDELVKGSDFPFFGIPAEAGTQFLQIVSA